MNISETIIYIDVNEATAVTTIVGKCKAKDFKQSTLKNVCDDYEMKR